MAWTSYVDYQGLNQLHLLPSSSPKQKPTESFFSLLPSSFFYTLFLPLFIFLSHPSSNEDWRHTVSWKIIKPTWQKKAQLWPVSQRTDYLQCYSYRFTPTESMERSNYRSKNASSVISSDFIEAITIICSSDVLSECQFAIRMVTKAWLNLPSWRSTDTSSVVETILKVLFASYEDEILELIISIFGRTNRNEWRN